MLRHTVRALQRHCCVHRAHARSFATLPIIQHALKRPNNVAIQHLRPAALTLASTVGNLDPASAVGHQFTYGQLLHQASQWSERILSEYEARGDDLQEARVAYLVPGSFEYAALTLAIWVSGGVAVPLHSGHAVPELEYIVENSAATLIVAHSSAAARLKPVAERLNCKLIVIDDVKPQSGVNVAQSDKHLTRDIDESRRALIIYTSGTTGKPKGVVSLHSTLRAQIQSLVTAWEWQPTDHILHTLPLHHVHGVVNALLCAVWSGAKVSFLPKFDAASAWSAFHHLSDLTLFMAVPTIYSRLIHVYKEQQQQQQKILSDSCRKFRLMVSGSAALPEPILRDWQTISGHVLLERYGMTEIGMALSNPLRGERRNGKVGRPLPGVQVRVTNEGELQVKGETVFTEYWQKPDATRESFTDDGWFKTGDIVNVDERGDYAITGRASVDILKSAGYKISALDIEQTLLSNPSITECAVFGLPSIEYGQIVTALLVVKSDQRARFTEAEFVAWCRERLASYQIPRRVLVVDEIPRNAMGKVNKKQLAVTFADPSARW